MGLFSSPIKTLDDLFVHTLKDIYYAENQIVKNLPSMIEKAANSQLKEAFHQHLAETKRQVERLERLFGLLGEKVEGVECEAIDGILAEAKDVIGDCEDAQVCDAAMLSSAQAVEHYEITRYGSLIAWARRLGRDDCAKVLEQTLDAEKAADPALTEVAQSAVNARAA